MKKLLTAYSTTYDYSCGLLRAKFFIRPAPSFLSNPQPSKIELTRQTVLSLAKERIRENVIARLYQGSFYSTENKTDVLQK